MLVSPVRIHRLLSDLLEADEEDGPHTALLITPPGELVAHCSLPEEDEEGGSEAPQDDEGQEGSNDEAVYDEEDEEPYLEGPERLRLLLGLASQWEDDESPRVECELGRLFLRPISLPEPEACPAGAAVPAVKANVSTSFILVLNGTSSTPWSQLAAKADAFLAKW